MTPEQIERYARHLVLKEVGGGGQNALLSTRIAIVGAGGLGGPASLYLAAAGVGQITLIDDDTVSLSNLQRQVQFDTSDIGGLKTEALAARLLEINSDVTVRKTSARLTDDTAETLLADHDIVLDGSDNFRTRFLINQTAFDLAIPLISGAVGRFDAQVGIFAQPGPCYRCLVPSLPPGEESCAEIGIIGALTGIAGSVMALEAIKLVTGAGETLSGRLWIYDGLKAESRTINIPRDPACPACSTS